MSRLRIYSPYVLLILIIPVVFLATEGYIIDNNTMVTWGLVLSAISLFLSFFYIGKQKLAKLYRVSLIDFYLSFLIFSIGAEIDNLLLIIFAITYLVLMMIINMIFIIVQKSMQNTRFRNN